jgi:hypothetical protein
MPRRRPKSRDRIEQDFLDAIERLKAGRPQNPVLREKVSKGKAVKINIVTVAREADRARGLIARENCRYPEIRQLVLIEAGAPEVLPRSRDDVIKKLRAEIAELRVKLSQAQEHAAYHLTQRVRAERGSSDYKGRYERLKARVDKDLRVAQGNVVPLFPEDGDDAE